jgi:hypothetical protein
MIPGSSLMKLVGECWNKQSESLINYQQFEKIVLNWQHGEHKEEKRCP